jgi:tetratricopeptide (TPR) repeat protein
MSAIEIKKNLLLFCLLILAGSLCMGQSVAEKKSTNDQQVESLLAKATANINTNPEKAFSYLNPASSYKDQITPKQLLQLYRVTATAYYNQQSYISSLDYFYKCLALQKELDPLKAHYIYNNIACAYMELGNLEKTKYFLNQSLEGLKKDLDNNKSMTSKSVEAYLVYSNLAVFEIENKNYYKAIEMLHIHSKHSVRLKDSLGILSTYDNLSKTFNELHQNDSASYYLHKGIAIAKKLQSPLELASIYYRGGVNFTSKTNDSASYYFQKAYAIANKNNLIDIKLKSAKSLADNYESAAEFKKANEYLRIAAALEEQQTKTQSQKKIKVLEFENAQKAKKQQALTQLERRENLFIFGFILLIPITLSGFLLYRLQRTKNKKRKVENELLTQKMKIKNKELTSNALQMLQASEIIDATHNELKNLKTISDVPTNKMLNQIISDLKHGNQSFNKKEFEKVFIETDAEFYRRLIKEYPTLTKNEIRLCAFAKLGFSVKEISAITQQTSNSILVARSRLRKKIGLAESQSITVFFKSF